MSGERGQTPRVIGVASCAASTRQAVAIELALAATWMRDCKTLLVEATHGPSQAAQRLKGPASPGWTEYLSASS